MPVVAVEAFCVLGEILAASGQWVDAAASYEQAIHIEPESAAAHHGLAYALQMQGMLDGALEHYEHAIRLAPEAAEAHCNRSQAWLLLGDFERGWPEYEWRWQAAGLSPSRSSSARRWDGAVRPDRTILLRTEQGLGDTLQFIRYAPLVRRRVGRVLVECPECLNALLQRCAGIDGLVSSGQPLPDHNLYAPLLSLPGILGTTLATVPADVPYLTAAPDLVHAWARELASVRGFRVGIVWQGNAAYPGDPFRSIPLGAFARLPQADGVRLISLQKGAGTEQLADMAGQIDVLDLGARLDETGGGAFMDTAATMKNLDLVITSDTALAHLAGALAVPVWVALGFIPDWRFMLAREESPWYPSMRLFRQLRWGADAWADVFDRMADELTRILRH